MFKRFFILSTAFAFLGSMAAIAQPSPASDHADLSFVMEKESVNPGQEFSVGLHIQIEEDWHVYWRNPGDSGIPVRIIWDESQPFEFGDIEWPYPYTFQEGHLTTYGYKEETLLIIPVKAAENMMPGNHTIKARVEFLACKEICLPGFETLTVDVKIDDTPKQQYTSFADLFTKYRAKVPALAEHLDAEFRVEGNALTLKLQGDDVLKNDFRNMIFFATEENHVESSSEQRIEEKNGSVYVSMRLSRYLNTEFETLPGVLVFNQAGKSKAVSIVAKKK